MNGLAKDIYSHIAGLSSMEGHPYLDRFYTLPDICFGFIRILKASQYPCLRIRRDNDGAECDVLFKNNYFSLNSIIDNCEGGGTNGQILSTFIGNNNGYLVRFYYQNNGNYLYQDTEANQVQIINAGNIINESGFASGDYFDGINNKYLLSHPVNITQNMSSFHVTKRLASGLEGNALSNSDLTVFTAKQISTNRYRQQTINRRNSSAINASADLQLIADYNPGDGSFNNEICVNEVFQDRIKYSYPDISGQYDTFGYMGQGKTLSYTAFQSDITSDLIAVSNLINTIYNQQIYP